MADAEIRLRTRDAHLQRLFFRDGKDDVAHRLENVGDREWDRVEVYQPVAAARELDHVTGYRAEAERGAVDESELALLHRRDRTAAGALQRFGEEENRGERRAEVVRYLDHQLETVGGGQAVGETLRPVHLQPLGHLLHRAEQAE